ncbi:MAG: sulfur carrier protein ThiS [Proteobacteria bacterium]|nr:sulfur carrier protein ThiS [Pseudomonadota bacterium]
MQVIVNGNAQELEANSNLRQLLQKMGIGKGRIAIEINGEIVPRNTFPRLILQSGDSIEIVQAIGGG